MKPIYCILAVLAITVSAYAIEVPFTATGNAFGVVIQSKLPLSVRVKYEDLADPAVATVVVSDTETYSWKDIVVDGWYDAALTTVYVSVNGTAVKHTKTGASFQMLPSMPLLAVALLAAVFVDTGKMSKLRMFLTIGIIAVIMTSAFALFTEVTVTVTLDLDRYDDFDGLNGDVDYAEIAISCGTEHYRVADGTAGKICEFFCSTGYYKDPAAYDCIECNAKCAACTSDTVCSACKEDNGWVLSGTACICPSGNYVDTTLEFCDPCGDGCLACNDGDGECTSCDTGYYVNPPAMECGNCGEINLCTACTLGTILTCDACDQNYATNVDSTECVCETDRFLDGDNACISCSADMADGGFGVGCAECTIAGCIKCASGYYDDAGDCVECGTNCQECTATACSSCNVDYFPSTLDNSCLECATSCTEITVEATCLKCDPTCVWQGGACIIN